MSSRDNRIWEIDFIRGIALVLMIIFHFVFNLREFYGYEVHYDSGVFFYIGKVSAIIFILVSAVSSAFSSNNLTRALRFLVVAMVITLVTHIFNPAYGIKFGILHFLGTCILFYPFVKNLNKYPLVFLGIIIIALGQYFSAMPIEHNYLFIFNLTSGTWISADYYPLFPWFGVFLFGIALGNRLYPEKRSLFNYDPGRNPISFLGGHTLLVYLVHQPLLLLIIGAVKTIVD